MKISFWFKRTLVVVGGIVVMIQFIPVSRRNPPIVTALSWDSSKTLAIAQRTCFDCHSNETQWPWYSYIAPVSWLITSDVNEGRARFNFSEITDDDSVGSLIKRINNNTMPPAKYLRLHPEARLAEAEKKEFIAGLRRSFGVSHFREGDRKP